MTFHGLIYYGNFRGVHLVDQRGKAPKFRMTMAAYFLLCYTEALHSNHFLHEQAWT